MTIMEVANLIALNKSNYPNAYKNMTSKEAELLAKSWHGVLKNHEANDVFNAFGVALTRSEFPVTLAGIFSVLKEKKNSLLPTIDELFDMASKAARDISQYYSHDTGWIPYHEGGIRTSGLKLAKEIYDKLPPVLREWKHGPVELLTWSMNNGAESYARHQFREIIENRLERRAALGIGFSDEFHPMFEFTTGCLKSLDDAIGQKQLGENNFIRHDYAPGELSNRLNTNLDEVDFG